MSNRGGLAAMIAGTWFLFAAGIIICSIALGPEHSSTNMASTSHWPLRIIFGAIRIPMPDDTALWLESLRESGEAWKRSNRCPFCFTHLTEGQCKTKGCRPPASGFQKHEWPEKECVTCGILTRRWVPMALKSAVERPGGEELQGLGVPFCEGCDKRWRMAKLQRLLTLPGIKQAMREEVAALVAQWAREGVQPLEEA